MTLDATHDPSLRSWLASANESGTDFPIQNLPFGCFLHKGEQSIGCALGDQIVDLNRLAAQGAFDQLEPALQASLTAANLDPLLGLERPQWKALRQRLVELVRADAEPSLRSTVEACLVPRDQVEMLVPATIGDYTDFYASVFHATNVGALFRPDNPLLPNYKHIPIGYHGRSSTIVPSGTPIRRPCGQRKGPTDDAPSYGPCRLLDYELEVGLWIGGPPNALGSTIGIDEVESRLFGICLLNDWSARDIQGWEYQPLGPFLAKSFASSISPWIVTMEALAPFRCPPFERPEGDPEPLPYLTASEPNGGIDLRVQTFLGSPSLRESGHGEFKLSETTMANLYWTPAQMIAHHASNGCVLRPGDLYGTGTISGPGDDEMGALLEITRRGQEPLDLPDGTSRKLLEDGDEVILRGHAERDGAVRIGLGECRGAVLPAEDC